MGELTDESQEMGEIRGFGVTRWGNLGGDGGQEGFRDMRGGGNKMGMEKLRSN